MSAKHGAPRSPAWAAVFTPIGDEGRAVLVERRITEAIRAGILAEGERLPSEAELAPLFGVALVTVREALAGLRTSGLISTVRGRHGGSFVTAPHPAETPTTRLARMSRVELHDRAAHHRVLLSGCAELAAQRADPAEVDQIRTLAPAEDEPDVGVWRRSETDVWLTLAAMTQSARLTRDVIAHEADFGPLMRLPLEDPRHRAASYSRLTALADAVAGGRADEARMITHTQLRESLEALAELHAAVQ